MSCARDKFLSLSPRSYILSLIDSSRRHASIPHADRSILTATAVSAGGKNVGGVGGGVPQPPAPTFTRRTKSLDGKIAFMCNASASASAVTAATAAERNGAEKFGMVRESATIFRRSLEQPIPTMVGWLVGWGVF